MVSGEAAVCFYTRWDPVTLELMCPTQLSSGLGKEVGTCRIGGVRVYDATGRESNARFSRTQ